jgi:FkbM family methyltransferase
MARQARFYRGFLRPGDLAFDVGAHVGARSLAMRRAGARVVAIEPQRLFHAFLRRTLPADVALLPLAVGAAEGAGSLAVSRLHPTVSSLRPDFPIAVGAAAGFERVVWDAVEAVDVTTLDALIARFGLPRLVKLDVEGGEADALAGLSQPVEVVAFEYLPAQLGAAAEAVARLEGLGPYAFNLVKGEGTRFALPRWTGGAALLAALPALAADNLSGDIYARLQAAPE